LQERSRFLLLAALLALAATGFLSFAVQSPQFPYAIDYGEGMILDQASLIAEGQNIYRPSPSSPPYLIPSYPPLFMAVQAPMTRWFGLAFWYGRLIAELSAIVTAVCAGLVAAHFAGPRAGVLAGLTVIAIPFVSGWAQTVRVDLPAVAAAWGAIAALICMRRRAVGTTLSLGLMLAAGFTRQTVWVPACAAIAAHLLTEGRGRTLVIYAVGLVMSAAILAAALQHATGGFWFAVVHSNVLPFEWAQWTEQATELVRQMPVLLFVTIVTVIAGLGRREAWAPVLTAYLVASLPSVIGAAKIGSNMNYFLELGIGCALAAAFAWRLAERMSDGRARYSRVALTTVLAAQALWWIWINHPYRVSVPPYLYETFRTIAAEPGPVLTDAAMGMLPLTGHHIWMEPFKMSQLARAGLWNEQPLLDDLHAKRFGLIVVMLESNRPAPGQWTPRMWSAIQENYRRCGDIRIDTRVLALYRPSCTDS
jgi:hypothetical protein